MSNSIHTLTGLSEFMRSVLPDRIPLQKPLRGHFEYPDVSTREDFIRNVELGVQRAPMPFRLSPHILSVIDWADPLNDPVRRQFIPLYSSMNTTHPAATLDPVQETDNSPVRGLIHRYPNKALFLGKSSLSTLRRPVIKVGQQLLFAQSIAVSVVALTQWEVRPNLSKRCDFFQF